MQKSYPWIGLSEHYTKQLQNTHLKDLLSNAERNQKLVAEHDGIVMDLTHTKINSSTFQEFQKLANGVKLQENVQKLFNGEHINITEDRAVLHTILRAPADSTIHPENMKDTLKNVHQVLQRIKKFSANVRNGSFKGATGKQLKNLVVIGIGGSYLSIEFVYEALRSNKNCIELAKGRTIRFLANVDPIDFSRAVENLNPQQTLFLVNSKTFTTAQTMLNAHSCKSWLIQQYNKVGVTDQQLIAKQHICACSTNLKQTGKFGISEENVFGFWDFVGGRFSVWSAIGVVPLSIHFGYDTVQQFLKGGHNIDKHLINEKDIKKNLPLLLGLVGFYHTTIQGFNSRAIVPYCQALNKFAPHIQQLDMESNGKSVNLQNQRIDYSCAVVNFGQPGTNGQHSFFQLLHQGRTIPVQFIGFTKSQQPVKVEGQAVCNHDQLMSNFFSQPDALAIGKSLQTLKSQNTPQKLLEHKHFPGDRPSISLLFLSELNAYRCGQLLAMYEHRTSIEGFIWNVNSYDQWGVELGKVLAKKVRSIMQSNQIKQNQLNSATSSLLSKYLANK